MARITLFVLFLFAAALLPAQPAALWQDAEEPARPEGQRVIVPEKHRLLRLDAAAMLEHLAQAPAEKSVKAPDSGFILELPAPDGRLQRFRICESPILAPGLAKRFPGIKTYLGKGVDSPTAWARLDYTPQGFHAFVLDGENTFFIDPYYHLLDNGLYLSYYRRDFERKEAFECQLEPGSEYVPEGSPAAGLAGQVGEELRTYRLAVSATAEYTQFHGGTVDGAMAAIATTMNRVNGVYERDISCRMILIDSNHLLVFTNPTEDPFSGSSGNHLGQNQSAIDQAIGSENYDIGHVFHRAGGGGVAFLASVCSPGNKARGFTSTTSPVGDPFDIDYVAHEMGHQFGANHTQNNQCNRNAGTAMEPGSASTIMGYAGICPPDLQSNSDAYFHAISLQEMILNTTAGTGNGCPEIITTGNTAPLVEAGPNGEVIPFSTPFELSGSAEDLEGDSLTYCWEQFDLGPSASPNSPVGNSPIFRSFDPAPNPTRVFPRLPDLVNNTTTIGEFLPNYARNLNFRLTVRDNHGFGGGVEWDNRTLTVTGQAGPFRVLSQNTPATWEAGTYQTIQWDVAQTSLAPVEAAEVDIYLSADGGYTYPILLASAEPNDGNALILVPDSLQGNQYRVKVKASGRSFFDINNANITILPAAGPGLTLGAPGSRRIACAGDSVAYSLLGAPVLGLEGPATLQAQGLPEGVTAGLDSLLPLPGQATLALFTTAGMPGGAYPFQLIATAGGQSDTLELVLELYRQAPEAVQLLSPASGEAGVAVSAELSWESSPDALDYRVDVAFDPFFTDVFLSAEGITGSVYQPEMQLPDSTTLFWRVQGRNPACGYGEQASDFFQTETIRCNTYRPDVLPVSLDTAVSFVISRVQVPDDVVVRDVNIRKLRGVHTPLSGLNFRFGSPVGPLIDLITEDCNAGAAFNLELDDEAAAPVPCPFNNGNAYRPEEKLSVYDGQNAQGTWRLVMFKSASNGSLQDWELEICFPAPLTAVRETSQAYSGLKLYPNPAGERVMAAWDEAEGAVLQVRSLTGVKVLEAFPGAGQQQQELQLGTLPPGLYIVQLFSREGRLLGNGKFIRTGE